MAAPLTPEEASRIVEESTKAQGLPRTASSPVLLARVRSLIEKDRANRASTKGAA